MIEPAQVFDSLIEACPSFASSWQAHKLDFGNDVLYVAAGSFAHHLLHLAQTQHTHSYPAVGLVIEHLLTDGTDEVKALAVIGVLEGVQNQFANKKVDLNLFSECLGVAGRQEWQNLNAFWAQE